MNASVDPATAGTVAPLVFIVVALSVLLLGFCCCCGLLCLAPLVKLISLLFVSLFACFGVTSSRTVITTYQKTNSRSYNTDQYDEVVTPLNETEEVIATDAYFTAPLVSAHVVKDDEDHTIVLGQVIESQHEEVQQQSSEDGIRFNDFWFSILFLINVIIIISLSIREGISIYNTNGDVNTNEIEKDISDFSLKAQPIIFTCLVMGILATLMGSIWLNILLNYAEFLIKTVMIANIVIAGVSAFTFLINGVLILGIIFTLCTFLSYWYYISVQNRIPFATAILTTAITSIKVNLFGLLSTAYSLLAVLVIYVIIWSISILGAASYFQSYSTHNEDEETRKQSMQFFCYFLLAFSLYWTVEVNKNILQVTVSGATATWFFQPNRAAPVKGSLFRALTTSFGSICFGSLLVAIVQTLRDTVHLVRNKLNANARQRNMMTAVFLCILDQMLAWLETMVRYFNRYAFVYCAAWGKSYLESGRSVWSLFERRGWTTIINDDLISNVLTLSILALSLFCSAIGYTFAYFFSSYLVACGISNPATFLSLIGAGSGVIVGNIIVCLLHASVACVFVCLAEDPIALQRHHPNSYEDLVYKWQLIHPGTLHINVNTYVPEMTAPMLPSYANKV